MLIKCITLHNFRQFKGKQKLVFSNDPKKNVTVLLGDIYRMLVAEQKIKLFLGQFPL